MISFSVICFCCVSFFFFKQKTAYEMRISDWSSDVCSSDLTKYGNFSKFEKYRRQTRTGSASRETKRTLRESCPAWRRGTGHDGGISADGFGLPHLFGRTLTTLTPADFGLFATTRTAEPRVGTACVSQ